AGEARISVVVDARRSPASTGDDLQHVDERRNAAAIYRDSRSRHPDRGRHAAGASRAPSRHARPWARRGTGLEPRGNPLLSEAGTRGNARRFRAKPAERGIRRWLRVAAAPRRAPPPPAPAE